jgi:hypothetical protein
MNYICPHTLKPCYSSGCYFESGYNKICAHQTPPAQTFTTGGTIIMNNEGNTGVENERIEKEAEEFAGSNWTKNHVPVLWENRRSGYKAGYKNGWNDAIEKFYELMDKELQTEPINRARYMNKLFDIKESLITPQKEQTPQ